MNGEKPYPRTVYCEKFKDILYACQDASIDLSGHFLKIEYFDSLSEMEEE